MSPPRFPLRPLALAVALLSVAPAFAAPLGAAATLQVRNAAVLPTPPGAPTASAHLVVVNPGRRDETLTAVSSPDAGRVEVHAMDMTGGVMRMRPVPGPWRVPAGGALDLSPAAGRHLMLIGPRRPLRPGERVRLHLVFAHAPPLEVEAPVGAQP